MNNREIMKDILCYVFWVIFAPIRDMLYAENKPLAFLIDGFKQKKPDRVMKQPKIEVIDTNIDVLSFMAFFGSNSGRLYTHRDLKLIKNGGGSSC